MATSCTAMITYHLEPLRSQVPGIRIQLLSAANNTDLNSDLLLNKPAHIFSICTIVYFATAFLADTSLISRNIFEMGGFDFLFFIIELGQSGQLRYLLVLPCPLFRTRTPQEPGSGL